MIKKTIKLFLDIAGVIKQPILIAYKSYSEMDKALDYPRKYTIQENSSFIKEGGAV